jgi:N-acetylglucosaminyldiphosphoundecaprenol N-acetyl-beta-D-mannosaminyltransferase
MSSLPSNAPEPLPPRASVKALPVEPRPRPESVPVLGIPLSVADYEQTMDFMDDAIARREPIYISAAAVHLVMVSQERPEVREAVLGALAVPDGQPLVWALRALGHRASRVYGPDLMLRYSERCAHTGARIFLYGGRNQGALVQLVTNLRLRFPGIQIVGGFSPSFDPPTEDDDEAIAATINASRADVVWVGVGQPKQEEWMARMRGRVEAPVMVGVGAAFDFHAGLVAQAPAWMQRTGLEWAFRLGREPRRLWRRYARYNPRFVAGFTRQYARHRLPARKR